MTAALGLISVLTLKFPPFRAFYLSHPRYILQLPDTLLDTFVTLLPCLARQSANPKRSKSPPRAVQTAVPVEAQGNQAERSVSGNGEEGVTPPAQTVQPRFPRSSHQKVAIATLKVLQTLAWCPEEGCLPRFVMLPFLFSFSRYSFPFSLTTLQPSDSKTFSGPLESLPRFSTR
jgi:hypothetical protein